MAERVLSTREINRAVLARQLLLERAALSPEEAAARVAGLQTQYAPSGYVGMWSRLAAFGRADLTEALLRQRMIQAWVMRCTIHMVAAADYWVFTEAVRVPRQEWWLRVTKAASEEEVARAAEAVRGHLAEGPLKQAQIQKLLAADGFPREVWPGVQLWVDLVRVPPAGTWGTPRAHVYGLAEHSVPRPEVVPSEKEAQEVLAERYLAAFGPASAADMASFCGWPITLAKSVVERLDLRRFRDETGGELVDVPGAPLPSADAPAPVRFLGQWDANLLAHARRAQILPEEHRSKVFATTMPQSVPTFLVDGQVAGTWRFTDGAVRCEPFGELPPGAAAAVAEEAERLTAFHSG